MRDSPVVQGIFLHLLPMDYSHTVPHTPVYMQRRVASLRESWTPSWSPTVHTEALNPAVNKLLVFSPVFPNALYLIDSKKPLFENLWLVYVISKKEQLITADKLWHACYEW